MQQDSGKSFKIGMKVLSNKIAEHFTGGESNRIS